MFSFVKKILLTDKNDISTLQNNGYCNALIISSLGEVPLLKNTLHCFANP